MKKHSLCLSSLIFQTCSKLIYGDIGWSILSRGSWKDQPDIKVSPHKPPCAVWRSAQKSMRCKCLLEVKDDLVSWHISGPQSHVRDMPTLGPRHLTCHPPHRPFHVSTRATSTATSRPTSAECHVASKV